MSEQTSQPRVCVITLGCARNEVDSSELAGRLATEGWLLTEDASEADVALVNTCGFVEQAKKDSVDTLLDVAGDGEGPVVVAVGCLAERYGKELAQELPEVAAVLGFDSYADMADRLTAIMHGDRPDSHAPVDRRKLLPVSPIERAAVAHAPGEITASAATYTRHLEGGPCEPLKLASGCDRRCTFCAIPAFRGSFVSRHPQDILTEAQWLAEQGVSELYLVSENTTSYGKDLGEVRLLEQLLPQLGEVDGIERIRVSYLQPAEIRAGLLEVIAETPCVVPYFDVSFQHASASLLRRMRRYGDLDTFVELTQRIRTLAPKGGLRSNFIVGFPGETDAEFADLVEFVQAGQFDVVGVFEYSDEDGTEAAGLPDKVPAELVAERADELRRIAETTMAEQAELRIGDRVTVLVEERDGLDILGRADHQAPAVDGVTALVTGRFGVDLAAVNVGDYVQASVVDAQGADLVAEPVSFADRGDWATSNAAR